MVRPTRSRFANSSRPARSSAAISMLRVLGSAAVPALPGATSTCVTIGDCAAFHANACSRPPPPMMRTFMDGILVPEVPDAGKNHRHAVFVGCSDDFEIAHRPARLNHCLDAVLRGDVDAIAEREEGI